MFVGVYLLLFYNLIDGSDVGFDFIDYSEVDLCFGSWEDIKVFGVNYDLMVDLIVNYVLV